MGVSLNRCHLCFRGEVLEMLGLCCLSLALFWFTVFCLHSPNSLTLCYILLAVAIFCLCNVLAEQTTTVEGIGVCKLSCVN